MRSDIDRLRAENERLRSRINAAFAAFEEAGFDLSENDGDLSDLVRELAEKN